MAKTAQVLILILAITALSEAGIIYVPDNFSTIQDAILASSNGDTIVVRNGIYYENITFAGKEILLRAENGPICTIIDGSQNGSVVMFNSGENRSSVLEGFALVNGTGSTQLGTPTGGGIFCFKSSPTIRDCIIENNIATVPTSTGSGGGVFSTDGSPLIEKNIIRYNLAFGGGGICCVGSSQPVIKNNLIKWNSSFYGGGIDLALEKSIVVNNIVSQNNAFYCGGGISVSQSNSHFVGNLISHNKGGSGGGLCCDQESAPRIINCSICDNRGRDGGGGVYCMASYLYIRNTILWGNISEFGTGLGKEILLRYYGHPSRLDIAYSTIEGGLSSIYKMNGPSYIVAGPGLMKTDPIFFDVSAEDYHLTYKSPCKNTGDSTVPGIPLVQNDFEGDPRVVGSTIDIGADEFSTHLYSIGTPYISNSTDIRVVGQPGEPVLLALGRGIQDPPQSTPYGDFHLTLPLLKQLPLGIIPPYGVRNFTANIPSGAQSGKEFAFQALVGSFGGPNSVLTNLLKIQVESFPLDYRYDDGSSENLVGFTTGGDLCWMHKFDALPGAETIVNVQQIFGCPLFPGQSPGNGTPCEFFVWDDPTNDGDPSDCILLTRQFSFVQNNEQNVLTVIPLSNPATVNGEFWIGAVMSHNAGQYCASIDTSKVSEPGTVFLCGSDIQGGFDPNNLMNNTYKPTEFGTYFCTRQRFCIRAGY